MTVTLFPRPSRRSTGLLRRLTRDTSGVAMLEFAFAMPVVLMTGLYGLECANMALANMRISQIALNLADNASRVGLMGTNQVEQLREADINDVFQGMRLQGQSFGLTNNARITLSSLENSGGVQTIHWQRCIGLKSGAGFDSTYGITAKSGLPSTSAMSSYDATAGINTDPNGDNSASHPGTLATGGSANASPIVGMGDNATTAVTAPDSGGVMFVEINYQYQPIVGNWLFGSSRIHYAASLIVRNNRDFSKLYQTSGVTPSTCDKYTA